VILYSKAPPLSFHICYTRVPVLSIYEMIAITTTISERLILTGIPSHLDLFSQSSPSSPASIDTRYLELYHTSTSSAGGPALKEISTPSFITCNPLLSPADPPRCLCCQCISALYSSLVSCYLRILTDILLWLSLIPEFNHRFFNPHPAFRTIFGRTRSRIGSELDSIELKSIFFEDFRKCLLPLHF